MFCAHTQSLEEARAHLRSLNPEDIINEAAEIVVDRAELVNNIDATERKWERTTVMQEEICELLMDSFTSFHSKLMEDVSQIRRKWLGGT